MSRSTLTVPHKLRNYFCIMGCVCVCSNSLIREIHSNPYDTGNLQDPTMNTITIISGVLQLLFISWNNTPLFNVDKIFVCKHYDKCICRWHPVTPFDNQVSLLFVRICFFEATEKLFYITEISWMARGMVCTLKMLTFHLIALLIFQRWSKFFFSPLGHLAFVWTSLKDEQFWILST